MPLTPERIASLSTGTLAGLVGVQFDSIAAGRAHAHLSLRPALMTHHGYVHAASVVALADTTCGYGCLASLPDGAESFTTLELKTNLLGTVQGGVLDCRAELRHGGRTTQVWDATVSARDSGKTLALFRCTQIVLYP